MTMDNFDIKKKVPEISDPGFDASHSMSDMTRRMRLLEERQTNFRKNLQVVEQNHIGDSKRFFTELKTLNTEITEIRREMADIKEQLKLVVAELRECAKREQVLVLEKYINFWEPLNFVTRREVEKLVERIAKDTIK